jgi:hypothetical protein
MRGKYFPRGHDKSETLSGDRRRIAVVGLRRESPRERSKGKNALLFGQAPSTTRWPVLKSRAVCRRNNGPGTQGAGHHAHRRKTCRQADVDTQRTHEQKEVAGQFNGPTCSVIGDCRPVFAGTPPPTRLRRRWPGASPSAGRLSETSCPATCCPLDATC